MTLDPNDNDKRVPHFTLFQIAAE